MTDDATQPSACPAAGETQADDCRIAEIRERLSQTPSGQLNDDVSWLLTRYEKALEAFRVPLFSDEAKDAHDLYRGREIAEDPYALEKTVEWVLSERRRLLEGENNG